MLLFDEFQGLEQGFNLHRVRMRLRINSLIQISRLHREASVAHAISWFHL
jgi:hypothetical protein